MLSLVKSVLTSRPLACLSACKLLAETAARPALLLPSRPLACLSACKLLAERAVRPALLPSRPLACLSACKLLAERAARPALLPSFLASRLPLIEQTRFVSKQRWAAIINSVLVISRHFVLERDVRSESVFVAQDSIPSLAGQYDNPIWRSGQPGYIGRRNRFLGIESWAS